MIQTVRDEHFKWWPIQAGLGWESLRQASWGTHILQRPLVITENLAELDSQELKNMVTGLKEP